MGFAFNDFDNTNDFQNWLSIGLSGEEFLTHLSEHAWKDETSFFSVWVDLYYNICFDNVNLFLLTSKNKEEVDAAEQFRKYIIDIYFLYEEELKSTNSIDFNDMIVLATKYVKENDIRKYKYIIVDEYQDTSYIRYLFLKEIINKIGAKIICVGDDYQSIYRFNGCNLNMFLNFKKYFGYTKILKINNTYRNSQELIDIAGNFVMKNKHQINKKLSSNKHINKPIKNFFFII